ncbi:MAG TPA: sialidase family protein [Lysobacter sp.]|nr:sialidase family protein [Lysobacter sp.]
MKPTHALALTATLLLAACNRDAAPSQPAAAVPESPPVVARAWDLPVTVTAAQPDLVATPDGRLLLSWVEPQGEGHALVFATFEHGQWGTPQTIARGDDWFVNWADTPHLAATADGALWAHWLQKSAAATYAYDVAMTRSGDGGKTWTEPMLVNNDGKPVEHGFVSLWPASRDTLGVAWLDGRESAGNGDDAHGGHGAHGGAMSLRTATFDARLQRHGEERLDAMTCDCCQTDVAMTARGPLLVFRDRTPEEIRDISVSRLQGDAWSTPRAVHADQWKMPACPVNGPAVAADGNGVVVGWYTAAGDVPTLKIAHSDDAGDHFAAPVTLDSGEAVQGRVDVALDADGAWVLWLREDAKGQSLQLARYAPDLSRELQRVEVARLQGRGRGTGFPQLALDGGRVHVVWTDVVDGKPQLRGAMLAP